MKFFRERRLKKQLYENIIPVVANMIDHLLDLEDRVEELEGKKVKKATTKYKNNVKGVKK